MTARMPTAFLSHGGGPWPWVEIPKLSPAMAEMRSYLEGFAERLPRTPRAVLVVSAHWEESVPTVQSHPRPPMLYDYEGLPPEAYEIEWPAPGAPGVAGEVRDALSSAGIENGEDGERGFDHGTFVVTKLMFPGPTFPPTFQLSLTDDLDPARALRIGAALAPLRDRGVFIIGSGFSYHNMEGLGGALNDNPPSVDCLAFTDWLDDTVTASPDVRDQRLTNWEAAPAARECHPREEHLLPLMVCAGAAGSDRCTTSFRTPVLGLEFLSAQFG